MPQTDSTIHAVSSAGIAKTVKPAVNHAFVRKDTTAKTVMDSVLLKDSLTRVDSLQRSDSLKTIVPAKAQPTGYEGKAVPTHPHNTPWVFGALFLLLLLLTVSLRKSTGSFILNVKTFFRIKEVSSFHTAPTVNFVEYRIYSTAFFLAFLALYLYTYLYNPSNGAFTLVTFGKFLGVTLLFYIFKILSFEFIGHVFFNVKQLRTFAQTYFGLVYALCIVLFLILTVKIYYPANLSLPLDTAVFALLAVSYILLLIKVFQIFYTKMLDVLYIFLYLCTLEILPLLIVFRVYNLIV